MTSDTYGTAVEMLPVPRGHTLTTAQVDGDVCVWCEKKLADTGRRLGPRIRVTSGGVHQWVPRACQPCISRQAARVHDLHLTTCARCTHRDYCPDSQALHKLALEYR